MEIAHKAGWDDSVVQIVTTAIAALEEAGYLKRGQNMPRIFADSISPKMLRKQSKGLTSSRFDETQKINAARIIKKLLSSRSRKHLRDDQAESRIDYISDHLGIDKQDVIEAINLLREEKLLGRSNPEEVLVEFSVFESKEEFQGRFRLINATATPKDIEAALFYKGCLSKSLYQ